MPARRHPAARHPRRTREFEAFHLAHHQDVRHFVARRTRPDEVDDVVAQVFATAWRRWDDLPKGEPQRAAWLMRAAGYEVLNQWRTRRRREDLSIRLAAQTPDAALVHVELVFEIGRGIPTELRRALATLSDVDQQVIGLVAWEGLDLIEVAERLGCSHGAARNRLYRARLRLREALAPGELR